MLIFEVVETVFCLSIPWRLCCVQLNEVTGEILARLFVFFQKIRCFSVARGHVLTNASNFLVGVHNYIAIIIPVVLKIFVVESCVMECCVSLEQVSFWVFSCWTSEYSCWFFWRFACLRFRKIKLSDVLVFDICLITLYPVGAFLASSLWHSRIVCRIMKIVSELACILLVFVQKMSGNFFGWWRISRSPVLPCRCECRPNDKFGSSKRNVYRLLTSLVAAEGSVFGGQ